MEESPFQLKLLHQVQAFNKAAENLMVSESVKGYALLLENIAMLPSEVALSQTANEIPSA